MKKIITNVLSVLIVILAILVMPSAENYYNIPKMITVLVGGLILLILLLINYKNLKLDKKDVIILIFAGLVFLSTMLSSNIKISLFGHYKRYEGMLTIFTYILIYFCAKKYLYYENKKMLKNVFYIMYLPICILGVMQHYINIPELYPIFSKGVCGTFGNTNFMGSFVTIGIAIFTLLYILKGSKLDFFTSNLVFFCMIACHARSSWVAFIGLCFIILIYLLKLKNKEYFKRAIILLISFALIFVFLIMLDGENPVRERFRIIATEFKELGQEEGVPSIGSGRLEIWNVTIQLIAKYPILGVGTDNLANGLIDNPNEDLYNLGYKYKQLPDKAHNEYLQIAATLGIPAAVIYLLFLFLNLFEHRKDVFKDCNIFIISSAIVCYSIQAFFNISTIGIAPIFWFLLGVINNENCKIIEE